MQNAGTPSKKRETAITISAVQKVVLKMDSASIKSKKREWKCFLSSQRDHHSRTRSHLKPYCQNG